MSFLIVRDGADYRLHEILRSLSLTQEAQEATFLHRGNKRKLNEI